MPGRFTHLVLTEIRGERVALSAERVAGQQQIYVKPLPELLRGARALSRRHARFDTLDVHDLALSRFRDIPRRALEYGAEHARLVAILGHDGDVETLSRELADKIRAAAISIDDPAVRAHVRQSLADALAINNPKWLTR